VKYKFSKFAPSAILRSHTAADHIRAHIKEDVAMTDELVLSQEDETQIHYPTRPVGLVHFAVLWITLSRRSWQSVMQHLALQNRTFAE